MGDPDARGRRGGVRGGPVQGGRRCGPWAEPVVRRGAPRGASWLRGAGRAPVVRAVSEAVLGPDYRIVEIGFDVPYPGAMNQPWHRDFRIPKETQEEGRLTSLAFNLTLVDTEEDMGPFEIAPGTQFDLSDEF